MTDEAASRGVTDAMRAINQAWLQGRVDDMAAALHPEIVMVFPGFAGQMGGRERFVAGFRDFIQSATIDEFNQHDQQIDIVGDTAVYTVPYEMVYTLAGERYRASGRDFWIFRKEGGAWIAVWRTMMDVKESAA